MAHNVTYVGNFEQPTSPVKVCVYVGTTSLTLGNFTMVKKNNDNSAFGAVDAGTTVTAELTDGYYELTIDENDAQVVGPNTIKCENTSGDIGTVNFTIDAAVTEPTGAASSPNDI